MCSLQLSREFWSISEKNLKCSFWSFSGSLWSIFWAPLHIHIPLLAQTSSNLAIANYLLPSKPAMFHLLSAPETMLYPSLSLSCWMLIPPPSLSWGITSQEAFLLLCYFGVSVCTADLRTIICPCFEYCFYNMTLYCFLICLYLVNT